MFIWHGYLLPYSYMTTSCSRSFENGDWHKNQNGPFPSYEKKTKQSMSGEWFFKRLENGEKLLHHWLVYLPSLDSIHCFCCQLFGSDISLFCRKEGFKNWRKSNPCISEHKQSHCHEEASMMWKEMCIHLERATINHNIQRKTEQDKETWRNILKCNIIMVFAWYFVFISKTSSDKLIHKHCLGLFIQV